ncbi:diguanylate cyclase domain-containing protein [Halodesulfovibrio marinisediminis]|uniref:Diguanylate cyclase (GGDEF) domain-containing protein n=1 Tax=Halodesulfovibrio marinisediminis DSM 17456 TaxID=1121457 RepID=A0A1N6ISH7_9BACT|nr:diguanylate cyclase [Halodesulfovibrio marinisediminis]SIO34982.1 diguanylate cyclase (GGDEF) domain-containing protein [Halodesulfovibrio marinisediminis DSM 17456]
MRWRLNSSLFKAFCIISVACCYVVFLVITAIYQDKVTGKEELVRVDQNRAVSIRQYSLVEDFSVPFADVRILADILSYRMSDNAVSRDDVLQVLYAFAENKRGYGQVRFLDATGYEKVRINREHGQIRVVPQDELQLKAHREYVKAAMRLGAGDVYVSPLDLNIENNKIEVPYVPVIRFVTPVINAAGVRVGFVVLNFYASEMLEHFQEAASDTLSNAMLLNAQGYWLVSDDKDACWAFMFEKDDNTASNKTLAATYPIIWEQTQKGASGQIRNGDGLFTWRTVTPSFAIFPNLDKGRHVEPPVAVSPYKWVVMQHVSEEKLTALKDDVFTTCVWGWIVLSAIAVSTLWFTLLIIQQGQEHREELEELAHNDWLTGLSNLRHMFSRLEEACEKSRISNVPFFVLYIDLDDFKFVNDRYGHEAGNIVLRHVASVLRKNVRLTDTVARIGGDEYVILLENMPGSDKAEEIAFNILTSFQEPVILECGSEVYVKASIGIAGWSSDISGADDLMKRADVAMYDSKNEGKNTISIYSEQDDDIAI